MNQLFYWTLFGLLASVIYHSGTKLTYLADSLGEKWQVNKSFVGIILLSTVTSLPELSTSLASVLLTESADLATGNLLGSNIFNLAIIPLLALLGRKAYLHRATRGQFLINFLVFLLYFIVIGGLIRDQNILVSPLGISLGVSSFILLAGYMGGLYLLFKKRAIETTELQLPEPLPAQQVRGLITTAHFLFYATVVILAGISLSMVGSELAELTGLGQTFLGTLFLAFATSLPEIVVCWVAIKQLQAVDLALGNIFGSCLFNLALIPLIDLAYPHSPVLMAVSFPNFFSAVGGITMLTIATYSIHYRQKHRGTFPYLPEQAALLLIYFTTHLLLYIFR